MKKYKTIQIISDDKFFAHKEIQEQMKKIKNIIKASNGKLHTK